MAAELVPTHLPALFTAAVTRAAELLRRGEVVALPTETVYGLAANALDPEAVAKIYAIKGRPAHNPIIVHVADLEMARRCVTDWPDSATQLAHSFWPGPLTLVLPRAGIIPDLVTAGGATVGVRWPSHPFMQAVIRACGFPLAAPSANLSNSISPTTAAHVRKQLGDQLALIVDGGPAQVGIESTVVDLAVQPPRVLRPGMIHQESLRAALGECGLQNTERTETATTAGELRSPGLLKKHYAPKARLMVLRWRDAADLNTQLAPLNLRREKTHIIAHTHIPAGDTWGGVSVMPHDAAAFARALYAELHHCDEGGAELIIVEALPAGTEWRAVQDRLTRAAAD
jgi:L-threonylcarbamoyladenylate synthase